MTQEHPITPPPDLILEWCRGWNCTAELAALKGVATQAARWGADQELEACCDTLQRHAHWDLAVCELMADRRPKPLSLKKLALTQVESFAFSMETLGMDSDLIRRALESLPS